MTKEEVLNSKNLLKRFCKDCSLPINVYEEPYFSERIVALDLLYDSINKFSIYCSELENFSSAEKYFEYYNSFKEKVINKIRGSEGFLRFNNEFIVYNMETELKDILNKNLYNMENDFGTFVSIDMKKANFSALHHYDKSIFDGRDTWEAFAGQYTDKKHIINSKYIRQVIFGACNPKKQIQYETYLSYKLLKHFKERYPDLIFYSISNDEIIFQVKPPMNLAFKDVLDTIKQCPEEIGNYFRAELFVLWKLNGIDGWAKRPYFSNIIELKGVSSDIYHQVVKYYYDKKITKNDLVFSYQGKLAKFLDKVDDPWKKIN